MGVNFLPINYWNKCSFPNLNLVRSVLPNNRAYLVEIIRACQPIFVLLAWEPRGQQLPPTTFELRSLVKDKVHAQDANVRAQLESSQWNITDEHVLRMLYGDLPLEKVRTFPFAPLYLLDLSVPVVYSSNLYASAGKIIDPGGDIMQAHFRWEGMASAHRL